MIVVGASVLLELLLHTGAGAVEARYFGGSTLDAPHVLDMEVA